MEQDKLFYLMFLAGVCLWQYPVIKWLFHVLRTRLYLQRNLGRVTQDLDFHCYGKLGQHIHLLIAGAEAQRVFPSVETFYMICAALFLGGYFVLRLIMSASLAVSGGIFLSLLPYSFLQVRLHEQRVERSKEGDILVQELLNQYQMNDYNMQTAIEKTSVSLEGAPLGKRLYLQLAKGLQQAVTKREVEDLLVTFRYAFDTTWGNILASNIFFAHLYGVRVDGSLHDLLRCMTQSRKAMEYGRRENHEAKLMLLYLAPVSYLLSIFFACRYFDFTIAKFFQHQLANALGLQWFCYMICCYVISLLIHRFLAKEKMDI